MERVDNLMQKAVVDNVFPGGVLLISRKNSILFFKAYGFSNIFSRTEMARDTIFDLASLTKPLATTLAIAWLVQQDILALEDTLGSVLLQFDKTEKAEIQIRHLLCHNSGLPDYRPYYKTLRKIPIEDREKTLLNLLLREPLPHPIGKTVEYSDLGFMILKRIVESVSGQPLDHIVAEHVYEPLGLKTLFFAGRNIQSAKARFAATEICPWRKALLEGVVHDENAYVMGGVEGHAGLFGTAADVNILLSTLLASFHGKTSIHIFEKDLIHVFFRRQHDSDRALGFDMPSWPDSSCGKYFSERSVGHLGFTGTSFWVDLESSITVILLTNRVHPSRDNIKIRTFRPKLHNTVMEAIMN